MTQQEYHKHIKNFGIQIFNSRFVYCKRCRFALTYSVGDTFIFVSIYRRHYFFEKEYFGRHYVARVLRIHEEGLMEVTPVQGNDEPVIVVESYYVIRGGDEMIEWKSDRRRHPSLTLEGTGGDTVYALSPDGDNLDKALKEGDRILFLEQASDSVRGKLKYEPSLTPSYSRNINAKSLWFEV